MSSEQDARWDYRLLAYGETNKVVSQTFSCGFKPSCILAAAITRLQNVARVEMIDTYEGAINTFVLNKEGEIIISGKDAVWVQDDV